MSATLPANTWQAARTLIADTLWSVELRLHLAAFGFGGWPSSGILMSAAHSGIPAGSNPWPAQAQATQPSTWAIASFGWVSPALTHTFTGQVANDTGVPLADVEVRLFGTNPSGLIATTRTDAAGMYTLAFAGYAPAGFLVDEIDPPGTYSVAAAGTDANGNTTDSLSASSVSTLFYPAAPNGLYAPGQFVDAFGVAERADA